jgi:hypothetical protein
MVLNCDAQRRLPMACESLRNNPRPVTLDQLRLLTAAGTTLDGAPIPTGRHGSFATGSFAFDIEPSLSAGARHRDRSPLRTTLAQRMSPVSTRGASRAGHLLDLDTRSHAAPRRKVLTARGLKT